MYQYIWDEETGGLLLTTELSKFSKEPRPVYYKELDILGFNRYWNYPKDDSAPLMWAEANNYIYRGRAVAKTKGGSLYTAPELVILEEPKPNGGELQFVDTEAMVAKNAEILETLVQETIRNVYNTYMAYRDKVDVFYVAFSGGKDSVVTLDIVQRAMPHDKFLVLFGNTRMELPDTYDVAEKIQALCQKNQIPFYQAKSRLQPKDTWLCFGPPSTNNRWCCSVHKTSPQINLLREITGKNDFTGMAFTGVRAEESVSRSNYDSINDGRKHSGQMSCHAILNWNSAELFLYIYARKLVLNEAYKKGNTRAGCLVCPNSTGKHEYVKRMCYQKEVDFLIEKIALTSGKSSYSADDMKVFIENGFWRTRKTGRELNFGYDKHEIISANPLVIEVYANPFKWQHWAKTVGNIEQCGDGTYKILFGTRSYFVRTVLSDKKTTFYFENCGNSKSDIKFQSLMRSVIIKSLYCIECGECEAECKFGCISMDNGIVIRENCKHCLRCHDVSEHCLRYASIRNKIQEVRKMASPDRYFTFGVRSEWLEVFTKYNGGKEFWLTDGDNKIGNKKKDACKAFTEDAGLTAYNKNADGDKYTKCLPTVFADTIIRIGASRVNAWALILCNLAYTPAFNWFINTLEFGVTYTPEQIESMLTDVMVNDTKGRGKRNVIDSLRITMAKTPLGKDEIFAKADIIEKVSASGKETITMNSITRTPWSDPDPRVILYSLYKFAEECKIYQFRLSTLLDDTIERDGISPTRIFGLDRETMISLLNGLTVNYIEYIDASFTLGLETITLRSEKKPDDVLALF